MRGISWLAEDLVAFQEGLRLILLYIVCYKYFLSRKYLVSYSPNVRRNARMSSCKVVIQIFKYNAQRLLKYFVDT